MASARSSEPVVHRSRWRERRWLSTGHRSRDVVHGDSVARIQFLPGTRSRGEAPWHTTSTNRARQSRQGDLPCRSSFSVSVQRRCATSSLWCASRRASPTGTARGQRSVSTMSLPTHPTVSLLDRNSANKIGLALRSHWVDPRVEIGGGSDAPSGGKRRPNHGRRLSPGGTSLPPRKSQPRERGRMTQRNRLPREESRSSGQVVATLAPTFDRAGVLSGVQVSRAARAARRSRGATLTPLPRAR